MSRHFKQLAQRLLETELTGRDPFIVEIGCNDGIMMKTVSEKGIRHLGVDPSRGAADVAASKGVRVRVDFFEKSSATAIHAEHGSADVIFSANTISHISYLDSIFLGVDSLLAPNGVFIIEDRYLGDIIEQVYFDQIYDEHFYLFSVHSVAALAARFGFVLADVEHLPVHGGTIRYTIARRGARTASPAVGEFLNREQQSGLTHVDGFTRFAEQVERIRGDLVATLRKLRSQGKRVVGYGATSKSATVINYCGIGPDLIPFICDSTAEKQGRLTPGSHIPIRSPEAFTDPYPDYALLFAWNHADEIMAKESRFLEQGGRWIFYMPEVCTVPAAA
jgi:methylation protein EvaC